MATMAQTGRDIEQARGILNDKFCAECGYNLRTRPVVGRCPECGNEYDSRPLGMRGILLPIDLRLPIGDACWALATTAGGLLLMYNSVVRQERWSYLPAIALLIIGLWFAVTTFGRIVAYVRHRRLIRRSIDDSADE